jgi:hypothetical protein
MDLKDVINASVIAAVVALLGTLWKSWREQQQANRRPFLEKQLELCFAASEAAAQLVTEPHSLQWETARLTFWRLYWGPLSVVEDPAVESAMVEFGKFIPPTPVNELTVVTEAMRDASYDLAHAIRRLILKSWNVDLPDLEDLRKSSEPAIAEKRSENGASR